MNSTNRRNVRKTAAFVGGSAIVAVGTLSATLGTTAGANAAVVDIDSTTTIGPPPATESITEAVPAIRGPAPLWAGEAPDSNPQ
jgi:hypothetical protein